MPRSRKPKLETRIRRIFMGAIPVFVGVGALGLTIRFFGDQPILRDVTQGLNGNVNGTAVSRFFGRIF